MSPSVIFTRSRASSCPLAARIFTRLMGGGPRTFPGGINKWQWKRLHEKKAREKEKRLLDQEKQLYQARIRSETRASLSGEPGPFPASTHGPVSSKDQIKLLADRFIREGAEDLWNESDGPVSSQAPRPQSVALAQQAPVSSHIDLRKLFTDGRGGFASDKENGGKAYSYVKARGYSVYRGGFSRTSDDKERRVWRKQSCSSDEDRDEDEDDVFLGMRKWLGEAGSSAALGKCDVKLTKRRPLKKIEDVTSAQEVEMIRHQLEPRKMGALRGEEREKDEDEESILSEKRFDECGISPLTVKALTAAGYVHMTRVQAASLPVCLEGKDALVKAKAGTGKSAAFLLPAIESVLKTTNGNINPRLHPIHVLILCPTRELASQIAAEANAMVKFHDGVGVQTLVGGTRFKDDQKRMQAHPCQIIVATPGRLLDHIENKGGLSVHLMGLKMLVLDEADHLLNLGFRKDIEKLVDCLPRQRQSLLFTATVPKEVRRISQLVLRREHDFIDTVGVGSVETHAKVKQSFLVVPHERHFLVVHHLLKEHILQTPNYKVIVFCTTGMVTSLMYDLLRDTKMNVREMHSRKPQIFRTRVSDEFRESSRIILVTSDVSARGMNYPDVTLVIQVGIPCDREHYVHRLGRTGREGKDGEGILLLAPWEEHFLDVIKDLPLQKLHSPEIDQETQTKVELSMSKVDNSVKEAAYLAWLGYYNSIREIGREKTTLVELAKKFCESIGLQKQPPLFRKTALKMGLKDIPGIRIRQ